MRLRKKCGWVADVGDAGAHSCRAQIATAKHMRRTGSHIDHMLEAATMGDETPYFGVLFLGRELSCSFVRAVGACSGHLESRVCPFSREARHPSTAGPHGLGAWPKQMLL